MSRGWRLQGAVHAAHCHCLGTATVLYSSQFELAWCQRRVHRLITLSAADRSHLALSDAQLPWIRARRVHTTGFARVLLLRAGAETGRRAAECLLGQGVDPATGRPSGPRSLFWQPCLPPLPSSSHS